MNSIVCKVLIFSNLTDWKPWSPRSRTPVIDGISAGLNEHGEESYIGRGPIMGWIIPGKILLEGSAAFYVTGGPTEHVVTQGVEYFSKDATCNYKWVQSSTGIVIPNAVKYRHKDMTFHITRVQLVDSMQIGRINGDTKIMYYGYRGQALEATEYEVLVCDKFYPVKNESQAKEIQLTTRWKLLFPVET